MDCRQPRQLRRRPSRRLPRRPADDRVRLVRHVERRPPSAVTVLRELEVPSLAVEAGDDRAQPGPCVEPPVEQVQLGRAGAIWAKPSAARRAGRRASTLMPRPRIGSTAPRRPRHTFRGRDDTLGSRRVRGPRTPPSCDSRRHPVAGARCTHALVAGGDGGGWPHDPRRSSAQFHHGPWASIDRTPQRLEQLRLRNRPSLRVPGYAGTYQNARRLGDQG
jgi:hypothetical protein